MNPETRSSHHPDPEYGARRVYFENLTGLLLAQGLEGQRVGSLVAELDSHLEMTHADPIEEFGAVGELAESLVASSGGGRPRRYLAAQVAFGVSLGTAGAALLALMSNQPGRGSVTFHASMVANITAIAIGVWAMTARGGRSRTGRSTISFPPARWFIAYLAFVVGVSVLTTGLDWEIPTATGWVVLAVSTVASLATLRTAVLLQRIPVPGQAHHLRNLGWGWMGR